MKHLPSCASLEEKDTYLGRQPCTCTPSEPAKPQEGCWTLIAPDGRTWLSDSPLKCVSLEQRSRVPAAVALQRIFDAADEWCEGAIRLRTIGSHILVEVERGREFFTVIKEHYDGSGVICHIVEAAGIESCRSSQGKEVGQP